MDLTEARRIIREADEAIAPLFEQRMRAVREVAEWKKLHGLPILDKAQEDKALEERVELIADPELRPYYIRFLQDTMEVSKRYQHRLVEGIRVAYSGVEGAFAHIASRRIFPEGVLTSFASFADAYSAVAAGECDCAVLPIENSYAGEVGQVIDLMFSGDLYVNGVHDLYITQNLLGTRDAELSDIRRVISHPQALGQCRVYLRKHGFEEINAANTARAAQTVMESGDKHLAAIASYETADLYGLKILDQGINESRSNTTRFAVFSRAENRPESNRENHTFILLFTVHNEAGALAKAISVIGEYGYNMRVLRSRPMKDLPWKYYFYVEADGDDTSEQGQKMFAELSKHCAMLKVVGRFPTAGAPLKDGDSV